MGTRVPSVTQDIVTELSSTPRVRGEVDEIPEGEGGVRGEVEEIPEGGRSGTLASYAAVDVVPFQVK